MKNWMVKLVMLAMIGSMSTGCISLRKPAKRGCKTTSSNMGAERVLAGEKAEKKSKYKIKGMN